MPRLEPLGDLEEEESPGVEEVALEEEVVAQQGEVGLEGMAAGVVGGTSPLESR